MAKEGLSLLRSDQSALSPWLVMVAHGYIWSGGHGPGLFACSVHLHQSDSALSSQQSDTLEAEGEMERCLFWAYRLFGLIEPHRIALHKMEWDLRGVFIAWCSYLGMMTTLILDR